MSVKFISILFISGILILGAVPFADASTKDNAVSEEKVRQIQTSLKDAGFDPGPIDGIMGPQTKKAIRAFQYDTGILATGKLNEETEVTLGIDGAPPAELARAESDDGAETAARPAEKTAGDESLKGHEEGKSLTGPGTVSSIGEVREIQRALRVLEYNPGEINGMMSSATQQAIREFQLLNGLPVTGNADEQTREALLAAAGG